MPGFLRASLLYGCHVLAVGKDGTCLQNSPSMPSELLNLLDPAGSHGCDLACSYHPALRGSGFASRRIMCCPHGASACLPPRPQQEQQAQREGWTPLEAKVREEPSPMDVP